MENVPIYVKVDQYKELLQVLKTVDTKLNNVNKTIEIINSLKAKEDDEIRKWNENLEDIHSRLQRIREAFHE
ncbi:MAG: hypothetical protein OXR66_04195 [Candidatus Woesearchaeota archaeon]|nr:hypothetical protein [Candidatus Woesearchaeota archaeon]